MTASTKKTATKTASANVQKDYSCFPTKKDQAATSASSEGDVKFDKGAKKTSRVEGTRIEIPADAFNGFPALRYDSGDQVLYVIGVGNVGYISSTEWLKATRFRDKYVRVGAALKVAPRQLDQVLLDAGIKSLSDLQKKGAALIAELAITETSRWATQAETDAYIQKERALRERHLLKALSGIESRVKTRTVKLNTALKDVRQCEASLAKMLAIYDEHRKIRPTAFKKSGDVVKAAEAALLEAGKLRC